MAKKNDKSNGQGAPRYHDTWKLSVQQIKRQFQIEYGSNIDDFLDSIYMAGAGLSSTHIENHARYIARSHKMLTLVGNAVELLRTRHKNGEIFYWLLYYTYLSPQQFRNIEEIMKQLRPHMRDISYRTYYRRRKEAVAALNSMLWGHTAQDSKKF